MNERKQETLVLQPVSQRLQAYKEALARKKENMKKERLVVGHLDDSATDLSKYQKSPSRYQSNRPKFVSPGKVKDSLKLEFEMSPSSARDTEGSEHDSKKKKFYKEFSKKPQAEKDQEEAERKVDLHVALDDGQDEEAAPFSSLRDRYMNAVNKLKPETVDFKVIAESADKVAARKALREKRRQDEERKSRFATLVGSWDRYELVAQDRPQIRSAADRKRESAMAKAEDEVTSEWISFAEEAAETAKQLGPWDDGDDEDEDDLDYWIAEAKRLKAYQDARKKWRMEREEEKQEEEFWIEEAMKLRDADRKKKGSGGKKKPVSSLRPGMMRGNSFDDDGNEVANENEAEDKEHSVSPRRRGRRPGRDFQGEFYSDSELAEDEDDPVEGGTRRNNGRGLRPGRDFKGEYDSDGNPIEDEDDDDDSPRPRRRNNGRGMRPGRDFRGEYDSDGNPIEDDEDDEEEDNFKPSRMIVNRSLRPGMMRGSSFDEDPSDIKDDGYDEEPSSRGSRRRVGPDGRIEDWSDSENLDETETGRSHGEDDTETGHSGGDVLEPAKKVKEDEIIITDSEEEDESPKTPTTRKKKTVELIEDEALEAPSTPRNPDGTIWKNPLKAWMNKPKKVKEIGAQIIVKVPQKTDCWRKTRHNFIMDNAPFYWQKVTGDFQAIVKVTGDFSKMYDKAGLMVRLDEENWLLSGMEYFNDRVNHSTCVTRDYTDWSLAPLPENAEKAGIWFCIKRMGHAYESFYSIDGRRWIQTRQGLFTEKPVLKVGVFCACPMGDPYKVTFECYRVTHA